MCPVAQAREWRAVWNEVLAQGEFVRQLGTVIEIKTDKGGIVTLPIANLCRDDQLYVLEQTLAQAGEPPAAPRITATVSWASIKPRPDKPAEPALLVTLTAQGKELADASRAGDVEIDECTTSSGATLKLSPVSDGAPGTMQVVNHDFGNPSPPPHGLLLKLRFQPGSQPITQIQRLRGSFKIVTGEPQTITVKEPAKVKDRVLDDPLLQELGVKIVVNPAKTSQDSLSLVDSGNSTVYKLKVTAHNDRILRIMPTDADGRWHFANTASRYGSEAEFVQQFNFTPPGPKDLELRITLLAERSEERIPFDLSDLPVPKANQ